MAVEPTGTAPTVLSTDASRPSVPIINATPFTGEVLDKAAGNWREWKGRVYGTLILIGLWDYFLPDAAKTKPDIATEPRAHANWITNDRRACGYLYLAVSQAERNAITPLQSDAAAYWAALEARHKVDNALSQVHLIKDSFGIFMSTDGSEPFQTTVSKIHEMADRAWEMGDLTVDIFKNILCVHAFKPLPDHQFALLDRIAAATKEKPFKPADVLRFAEERQNIIDSNKVSASASTSPPIALAAQTKGKGGQGGCTNCGKSFHNVKYCISEGGGMAGKTLEESRAQRLKDKGEKPKATPSKSAQVATTIPVTVIDKDGRSFTANIAADTAFTPASTVNTPTPVVAAPPPGPRFFFAGTTGISADEEFDPDTHDYEAGGFHYSAVTQEPHQCGLDWNIYSKQTPHDDIELSALNQSDTTPLSTSLCPFYMDSGASTHLSPDRCDFVSLRPIPARAIHGVAGTSIDALAIGDVKLRVSNGGTIVLRNVLLAPNAAVRLISVSCITHDSNVVAHFDDEKCWLTDKLNGNTVANGTLLPKAKLYSLSLDSPTAEHVYSIAIPPNCETWHRRLGHANHQVVVDMARLESAQGMPLSFAAKPSTCDSCMFGKQTKSSVPKTRTEGHRATRFLGLVWVDLSGPVAVKSLSGKEYIMDIIDDYNNWTWTFFLVKKSDAQEELMQWVVAIEAKTGLKIDSIRFDRGEIGLHDLTKAWLRQHGIDFELGAPNTSAHIGKVERIHRTLMGKQRAMRAYAKLPPSLWEELYSTATYLNNRTITRSTGNVTPYQLRYNKKPDLSHLREIGCRAFVYILNKHNPKLWERCIETVLVGYDANSKAYRCYDRAQRKVISSYHVRFIESHQSPQHPMHNPPIDPNEPSTNDTIQSISNGASATPIYFDDDGEEEELLDDLNLDIQEFPVDPIIQPNPGEPAQAPEPLMPRRSARDPKPVFRSDQQMGPAPPTRLDLAIQESKEAAQRLKEAKELKRKGLEDIREDERRNDPRVVERSAVEEINAQFRELNENQPNNHLTLILSAITSISSINPDELNFEDDPKTWKEAKESVDADKWAAGYQEELQSLKEMGVYKLVPPEDVPNGHPIRKGKPIFKTKRDEEGKIARYKVRLVFKGFEQIFGRDYTSTTSPTARMESWRILLHIAAALGWDTQQIDVKTAFLYGLLPDNEVQYMQQPEGFEEPGKESWLWKLQRGLYGMKQSGRIWNRTLNDAMLSWNFIRLTSESCIYYRLAEGGMVIAAVHVDDFMSIASSGAENKRFKDQMKTIWTISELGEVKFCVGIAVARDLNERMVYLSQIALIDKVIALFGQKDAHSASSPMDPGLKLRRPDRSQMSKEDQDQLSKMPYRSLVGCLIYLTVGTRPDIAYAVQQLSQFLDNFSFAHWNAAIRVVRYLKGTRELRLGLGGSTEIKLIGFSDSDWANCLDTRRSVGGYGFSLGSGLISWASRKQKTVATSSCEAEYTAAFEASKEAIWLRSLLSEIRFTQSNATILLCDNTAAISLSEDPSQHGRSKHFDIKCHFLRERVQSGEIRTTYINTKDNIADIFTKALPTPQFERLRSLIGLS